MADDLKALTPQSITMSVTVDGSAEQVTVKQVKMKQLADLFKVVGPLLPLMKDPKAFQPETIFMQHTDSVMQLIAVAMGKPVEWVWAMEVPDAIELFAKVLEVNLAFFTRSILPSLLKSMQQIKDVSSSVGQKASIS